MLINDRNNSLNNKSGIGVVTMLKQNPDVLVHSKELKIRIEDCFKLEIFEDEKNTGLLKDFYLWFST